MDFNNTIIAIASAPGIGALGIIRISGRNAINIVEKVVSNKKRYNLTEVKKIHINVISNKRDGNIDEVTIIKYQEPNSFTGENMVEIFCHGGPVILKKIVNTILDNGAISAQRGEFTKRAFLNGKFNLLKAEAINGMIKSENEIQHKISKKMYYGEYEQKLQEIRNRIENILIEIEAEIEFFEEDDVKNNQVKKLKIEELLYFLNKEIEKNNRIKKIQNGIKILIAGPANAGKSSLFNYMLGYNRAIINEKPGTTRDLITEKVFINDIEITLIDSAGIRDSQDEIEIEGINKSKQQIDNSHIIIWVTSSDEKLQDDEIKVINNIKENPMFIIINKCDKKSDERKIEYFRVNNIPFHLISVLKEKNIEVVFDQLKKILNEQINTIEIPDLISNYRQEYIVYKMKDEVQEALKNWESKEIVAFYLNEMLDLIEEFLGKRDKEKTINKLFDNFCIGK